MTITTRVPSYSFAQVCARRLARHGLAEPHRRARPADVVAAMAGAHAQVPSAAELGVALRMAGGSRAGVRDALNTADGLVRTFGPRGTVHLLPMRDLPLWTGALSAIPPAPSPFPAGVRMSAEQTEQVVDAIGTALAGAELTVDELGDAVVSLTGPWAGDLVMPAFQGLWPRWRQALHLAGTRGVLCFGPNRGRRVTYTSPTRWLPGFAPAAPGTALEHVVTAFLSGYGPATPQRFAHWLNAPVGWATEVFASMAGALRPVLVEGEPAWEPADAPAAPAEPPAGVRLLPYFDGYAYRVGNQPPALLYPGRATGRVLPGNFQVLLVDGVVGGLWHQRRSGSRIDVTVEPLVRLAGAHRADLDDQVTRLGELLAGTPRLTLGTVTTGGHA